MVSQSKSFGQFARKKRVKLALGLRQAARQMKISAAYLSRVENDVDPPSSQLIMKMSAAYHCDIEELIGAAERPSVSAATRGRSLQLSEELRALYRMGGSLTAEEVEDMIRYVLAKRKMSDADIEKELASLREELPRIRNSQREGMFAADIKPRYLSRQRVEEMAYKLLSDQGLDDSSYSPPTPIESLADGIDGVRYEIRELPNKDGEAIVLGLTRRDRGMGRQVVINSVLADSDKHTDTLRFNFTLAHELFHAIEHLPLAPASLPTGMMRHDAGEPLYVELRSFRFKASRAQKAVDSWVKGAKSHRLFSNEDWREWQANTFAAALLMPRWAVQREFNRRHGNNCLLVDQGSNIRQIALDTAGTNEFDGRLYENSLADLFAVSRQAMAIRLIDVGLIREVAG